VTAFQASAVVARPWSTQVGPKGTSIFLSHCIYMPLGHLRLPCAMALSVFPTCTVCFLSHTIERGCACLAHMRSNYRSVQDRIAALFFFGLHTGEPFACSFIVPERSINLRRVTSAFSLRTSYMAIRHHRGCAFVMGFQCSRLYKTIPCTHLGLGIQIHE